MRWPQAPVVRDPHCQAVARRYASARARQSSGNRLPRSGRGRAAPAGGSRGARHRTGPGTAVCSPPAVHRGQVPAPRSGAHGAQRRPAPRHPGSRRGRRARCSPSPSKDPACTPCPLRQWRPPPRSSPHSRSPPGCAEVTGVPRHCHSAPARHPLGPTALPGCCHSLVPRPVHSTPGWWRGPLSHGWRRCPARPRAAPASRGRPARRFPETHRCRQARSPAG